MGKVVKVENFNVETLFGHGVLGAIQIICDTLGGGVSKMSHELFLLFKL